MYLATGDQHYLTVAEQSYTPGAAWGQSWDEKTSGCMVGVRLLVIDYAWNPHCYINSKNENQKHWQDSAIFHNFIFVLV